MTEHIRLIGDIGGTNARFALATQGHPGYRDELTVQSGDYAGIDQAIRYYLDQHHIDRPYSICLAIAGPVTDQKVQLTNNAWFIAAQELERQFSTARVALINDFTAIALSIPVLTSDDYLTIGTVEANSLDQESYSIGVIGPGTGLGIAGVVQQHGNPIAITSEAGHMGFAPETPLQTDILVMLRERWPRISVERLVSGQGLENIYWAMNRLNHRPEMSRNAGEIFQRALEDEQSMAYQSVEVFFEILGQVAGDIGLAYGANEGVYIAGGMVKRYPDMLQASQFRACFENKGRHRELMERIPTLLITHPQPGLLGASHYAVTEQNQ